MIQQKQPESEGIDVNMTDKMFAESWAKADGWFIPADSVSGPAAHSLDQLIQAAKHGGSADLILRVDGREKRYQADWIKYTRRAPNQTPTHD